MYNRYIPNERGEYRRIQETDEAEHPVQDFSGSSGESDVSESPMYGDNDRRTYRPSPAAGNNSGRRDPISSLLSRLHLGDLDTGDLLLLAILFLLFRDSEDDELLMALGLLLIL